MRGFLIRKNQSVYHWLKRRIGRERALGVAITVEEIILNMDTFFFLISFLTIGGLTLFWSFSAFIDNE